MRRIGPKMEWATQIVKDNPGCSKLYVAKRIAPHGTGIQYGYSAVNRAIGHGLITYTFAGGKYSLYVEAK